MKPIRQIIEDAPPSISVPVELQHRRVEIIFWPLDDAAADAVSASDPASAGWPTGLYEATAGAWEGDPLERAPQGETASRLEFE